MLKAGDVITCEGGHPICDVIAPIDADTFGWHRCLGNFRGEEPTVGTQVKTIRCHCGAEWVRSALELSGGTHLGFGLHVEGRGWIPPKAAEWKERTTP